MKAKFKKLGDCLDKTEINLPLISDTVEEKVKNRFIFPIIVFLIYAIIVVALVVVTSSGEKETSKIKTKVDLAYNYFFSQKFDSAFVSPRIKALDEAGHGKSNVTISFAINSLTIEAGASSFSCDSYERSQIVGSLLYYRLEKACKVILDSNIQVTDSHGFAKYGDLNIKRGPQGNYGYVFISDDGVKSEEKFAYFSSKVLKLKLLNNTYPPDFQNIGQPFKVQPIIQILDEFHIPIANKYLIKNLKFKKFRQVIAISWPEPILNIGEISSKTQEAYLDAIKYAYLIGDVSELSDSNGIARFTNLTVQGSMSDNIYIIFVCENVVTLTWGYPKPIIVDHDEFPFYTKPIQLLTNVSDVKIVKNILSKVTEGVSFGTNAPAVRVTDKENNPLEGKLVIAQLYSYNGRDYTARYKNVEAGYVNKRVINPFPANYDPKSIDPLYSGDYFIPIYTDKNGTVSFNYSSFSIPGPSGFYQIEFVCDGVTVYSSNTFVASSVKKLKFMSQPPSYFSTSTMSISSDFIPLIKISNEKDIGIKGKTPELDVLDSVTLVPYNKYNEFAMSLDYENSLFSTSDNDGMMKLYFRFNYASSQIMFIKIKITVEGISLVSKEIKFVYSKDVGCQFISLTEIVPNKNIINFGDDYSFKFQAYNTDGKIIVSNTTKYATTLLFDLYYISDGLTKVPSTLIPYFSLNVSPDKNGVISVSKLPFKTNGVSNKYSILPIYMYPLSDPSSWNDDDSDKYNSILTEREGNVDRSKFQEYMDSIKYLHEKKLASFCFGDKIYFTLLNKVGSIAILNNTSINNEFAFNTFYYYRLKIFNKTKLALVKTNVTLFLNVLHFPSYLLEYKMDTILISSDIFTFLQLTNETDANGEITVGFKMKSSFVGFYAINFKCQGILSKEIHIRTEFKVNSLEITSQPSPDTPVSDPTKFADVIKSYRRKGDFLPEIKVKLNSDAPNKAGFPIIAKIVNEIENNTNITAIFDYPDLIDDSGLLSYFKLRRGITDNNGIATFRKLTPFDIQGSSGCFKIKFFIGDTLLYLQEQETKKMLVSSGFSNLFCFYDNSTVEVYNSSYSRQISGEKEFNNPLMARIKRPYLTDMDLIGISHLSLVPFEILGKRIIPHYGVYSSNDICVGFVSNFYNLDPNGDLISLAFKKPLSNSECRYKLEDYKLITPLINSRIAELMLKEFDGKLSEIMKKKYQSNILTNITKNDFSYSGIFTFKKFEWTGSDKNYNFRLSSNTLLNYPSNTTLALNELLESVKPLELHQMIDYIKFKSGISLDDRKTIQTLQTLTELVEQSKVLQSIALPDYSSAGNNTKLVRILQSFDQKEYINKISDFFSKVAAAKNLVESLLIGNSKNTVTDKIAVSSDVASLELISDVRPVVYVGEIFQITVLAKDAASAFIPKRMLTASINSAKDITQSIMSLSLSSLIQELGAGKFTPASASTYITKELNIKLDPTKTSKKTNNFGYAMFNLIIVSGKSSEYRVTLTGDTKSISTSKFTLINPIQEVKIISKLAQTIELSSIDTEKPAQIKLSVQPIIQLNYSGDMTTRDKEIKVLVYDYNEDYNSTYKDIINQTNQVTKTFNSMIESFVGNKTLNVSASEVLSQIWNAIANSGILKTPVITTDLELDIKFTPPEEDANGRYFFTDLTIPFPNYGKYTLLFIVDGIESNVSDIIEIKKDAETENHDFAVLIAIPICLLIVAIFTIMANVSHYHYFFSINAVAMISIMIAIVAHYEYLEIERSIFFYIISGILICLSIEAVVGFFLKGKKTFHFSEMREKIFYEYTYQLFFNKESNNKDHLNAKQNEIDMKKVKSISDQLIQGKYSHTILSVKNKEENKNASEGFDKPKQNFVEMKFKDKIKDILRPFSHYLKERNLIQYDIMFYPQRLIAGMILSLASLIFISVICIKNLVLVSEFINDMSDKIYEFYLEYMNKGLVYVKNSNLLDVNENHMSNSEKIIIFVMDQFKAVGKAFEISFIIACCGAIILCFISIFDVMIDFKRRLILMRKGIKTFDCDKDAGGIEGSIGFVGTFLSNMILSFFVIVFVGGLILIPFFWPLFWIMIYNALPVVIVVAVISIVKSIVENYLMGKIIQDAYVVNRRVYGIYEFVMIYIGMGAGIADGLGRFIVAFIVTGLSISIVTEPAIPEWVYRLKLGNDPVTQTYFSLIYMTHLYNNPVTICVANLMIKGCEEKKKGIIVNVKQVFEEPLLQENEKKQNLKKRIRNKFYLALLLTKNKEKNLGDYRKNNLKSPKTVKSSSISKKASLPYEIKKSENISEKNLFADQSVPSDPKIMQLNQEGNKKFDQRSKF